MADSVFCSDSTCTGSCYSYCAIVCEATCAGSCNTSCNGTCKMTCEGCDKSCQAECADGCGAYCGGCANDCTSGCSTGCNTGCQGCQGSCTGGCNSCSGNCAGDCTATCTGDCNNACTAENQSSVIANLGANILAKGFLLPNDFTELRNTIYTELQRRGKTVPPAFSVNPAQGINVLVEHASKMYDGVYTMDATKDYRTRVAQGKIISEDDINDAIDYIKILMAQNIKL